MARSVIGLSCLIMFLYSTLYCTPDNTDSAVDLHETEIIPEEEHD